jgi:membrane protein
VQAHPAVDRWWRVLKGTHESFQWHGGMTQSAALAYYTIFSIAPLLVVVVAVAGLVFGEAAVRGRIVEQFGQLMGKAQAETLQHLLQKTSSARASGIAAVLGLITLVFGATAVFVHVQDCLNRIWEVKPREGPFLKLILRKRVASFALVLGIGFLLLVSLTLSAALAGLEGYIRRQVPLPFVLLEAMNVLFSFLSIALLFAMIYRVLPDAKIGWQDVGIGALATSAFFSIGKTLIGLYLGRTAVASPFGAAGSLVVILLWIYYTSAILLVGGEFTHVYTREFTHRRVLPEPGAVPDPHPAQPV